MNPHINRDGTEGDPTDIWANAVRVDATKEQKLRAIKLLLDRGDDINVSDRYGITPLHVACEIGSTEIVQKLLNEGACITSTGRFNRNQPDKSDFTPLHYAVDNGHREIVKLLLINGADVGNKITCANRPLDIATSKGYLAIAKDLFDHGAAINKYVTQMKNATELHCAVKRGHEQIVEFLVNSGAYINVHDFDNLTPLHYATENEHEKIVKLLLDHGAKFDPKDREFYTVLRSVIKSGNCKVFELFLNASPEMNTVRDDENRTFLHIAVAEAQLEVVKLLLNYDADIEARDQRRRTPIFYTVLINLWYETCKEISSIIQIFKLLQSRGANIYASDDYEPLLHLAIQNKWEEIVLILLQNNVEVDTTNSIGYTALCVAAKTGPVNIAAQLLKHGASINYLCRFNLYIGYTPLHFASQRSSSEMGEFLIKNGANVNARTKNGLTPILVAIRHGQEKIVNLLLKHGAELNAKDENLKSILNDAVQCNKISVITCISQEFPNVIPMQCDVDCTLVHTALEENYTRIAELLINNKANENAVDTNGQTPLFYAVRKIVSYDSERRLLGLTPKKYEREGESRAMIRIVKLLLNRGANHNAVDKNGTTPLLISVQSGFVFITKILLSRGADVSVKQNDGKTALHFAEQDEVARMLLEYGADVDSRDNEGKTALHTASSQGRHLVVTLLLDYGSDINIMNTDGHTAISCAVNTGFKSNGHRETIMILKKHMLKMKALNLHVSDQNIRAADTFRIVSEVHFYRTCRAEIEMMKTVVVGSSDITFHTLLTDQTGIYCANFSSVRTKNIAQALELNDYKVKFPLYANMINHAFNRAQKRKDLFCPGLKSFCSLLGYELPVELVEEIFCYLSNYDLKNLIDANCQPHSHSQNLPATLPWKEKKMVESIERQRRKNNVIIRRLMLIKENDIQEEIKTFVKRLTGRNLELEEVRELNDEGENTYLVRFTKFEDKMLVMNKKRDLKGSRVFIDNDWTEKEKQIQDYLTERANTQRVAGNLVRVGYMKMWMNNVEYKWDEETEELKRTYTVRNVRKSNARK